MRLSIRYPIGRVVYPAEIFTGPGSLVALNFIDGNKVCLVTTKSIDSQEAINEKITKIFNGKNLKKIILTSNEPNLEQLNKVSNELNDFMPDWIVAIGGGSVIDSAKILWTKYEHIGISSEELAKPFFLKEMGAKANLIVIPTTAGTGSEVSSSAVYFQSEKNKNKKFLVSHELIPSIVIMDPQLMNFLSENTKISGVLDAISHAVEGYVSPYANEVIRDYSVLALLLIIKNWDDYVSINSESSVYAMLRASNYAGYVQNMAIPGLAHAISHAISRYDIPHGLGCGCALISTIKYNLENQKCKSLYDELSSRIGLGELQNLINFIQKLIPKETFVNVNKIILNAMKDEAVLEDMFLDPTFKANPEKVDIQKFIDLVITSHG
jgi:alcohol dehydrogenase